MPGRPVNRDDPYRKVVSETAVTYSRYMSASNPTPGGPLVEGPHDPEHDPTASYALEPDYVNALTRRIAATSGRTHAVRSPLNGAPLAHVPQSSTTDVAEAFARARRAQESWARVPVAERAAALLRLHDLVLDRQDEIVDLIVWESGKARKHAFDEPLHIAIDRALLRAHRRRAPRHPAQARRDPGPDPGRGQPGPQGRRRHHLAVELPVHDGAVRRPAGARRGQRGGDQARRPDDALRRARRSAARGGRVPRRPVAGRGRPGRGDRHRGGRARRLRLLHRLHRHRQGGGPRLRGPADRLLAGARRQEPAAGPARRRRRAGRGGRGARVVLQLRPAVRLHRADLRGRPGLRPLRGAVRGPHPGDDPRRDPGLGQRHGLR